MRLRGHEVDVVGEVLPGTGDARDFSLTAELAVGSDFAGNARDFSGECVELIDHGVDGVLQLQNFAFHVDGDLARQIAASDGGRHFGDVADLAGEVAGHRVHRVGQVLPRAGDTGHVRLTTETAFGADLAGHASNFARECVELVDHGVDGFLQQENFAADVHRDLLGKVAAGDGC